MSGGADLSTSLALTSTRLDIFSDFIKFWLSINILNTLRPSLWNIFKRPRIHSEDILLIRQNPMFNWLIVSLFFKLVTLEISSVPSSNFLVFSTKDFSPKKLFVLAFSFNWTNWIISTEYYSVE